MARARITALVLAAALAGVSAGLAGRALAADPLDGPVSTADPAGAPPVSIPSEPTPHARAAVRPASGDATDRQIAGWIADQGGAVQSSGPVGSSASGDGFDAADAAPDQARRVHGEVSVGVGSRGYREVDGAVSLPVGQGSEVDLAVADARADLRHRGGVEQRSIALGVFVDGRDVSRALGHGKCAVPRWGVSERDDPVVNADGTCAARPAAAAAR